MVILHFQNSFAKRWIEIRKEGVRTFPGILEFRDQMFVVSKLLFKICVHAFLSGEIYNTNK